jgi:hypothetical protein
MRRQRFSDYGQHAIGVCEHIVVPEAQDTIAFRREIGIAPFVDLSLIRFVVLAAVELNHEALSVTGKINKIRTDWSLPSKM